MGEPESVEALLAERIGLDPDAAGSGVIARAVRDRMAALGLGDREVYERRLRASADEFQRLIEEVVVPESWFFRDARPFAFLQEHARGRWRADPSRPPLHLLSLPCARGEEAYSIAIALIEAGLPTRSFRIDAVDLSENCLAAARRAVYGPNAFRGLDPTIRERYFRKYPDGFELATSVRGAVRFLLGNLLDPALLADEPPYDVVFCRNLLIYFTDEARPEAAANLDRLVSPSGLLFLGHAERPEGRWVATGDRGSFAFVREETGGRQQEKGDRRQETVRGKKVSPVGRRTPEPPERDNPRRVSIPGAVPTPTEASPRNPSPPVRVPGPAVGPSAPERGSAAAESTSSALLDEAGALADRGRYDEATRLCDRSIREEGPGARAFFLLGMIRQIGGDRAQAEAHFKKAVYLDPQHDEALLALALLAQRRGDAAGAAGYRRRAERVLKKKGAR